jgi:hypothetical protein
MSREIKPDTDYWAWYECRKVIIHTSLDGKGFYAHGQEPCWLIENAEIICEVVTPKYLSERVGRCAVLENKLGIRHAYMEEFIESFIANTALHAGCGHTFEAAKALLAKYKDKSAYQDDTNPRT